MAGPASNFDAEIKKGMKGGNNGGRGGGSAVAGDQQPGNKSSTNTAPDKAPADNNKTNEWNQSSGPTSNIGSANGDTHARMIAAGQAHMQAIHDHITAMSGGGGGGGLAPVNAGTKV